MVFKFHNVSTIVKKITIQKSNTYSTKNYETRIDENVFQNENSIDYI